MSFLYIVDNGSEVAISGGTFVITKKNNEITKVPKETIEGISIFGNSYMTTPATKYCLSKGIRVSFFSKTGSYYGCLMSPGHVNVGRVRNQVHLTEDEDFSLAFSKKIITAKINNQLTMIKRYLRNQYTVVDVEDNLKQIKIARQHIGTATDVEVLMGYEGSASKNYFEAISKIINPDFAFKGRNRRPPKDPFNSMLSLGYTLVMYEIYGELENRGLNPYFGFMHKDREKHPTLASDLIEEWRAVIVDSTVLSLIQGHEISISDFYKDEESAGCFLTNDGAKKFLGKMEKKLHSEAKYLDNIEGRMAFRKAIWHQVGDLAKMIETGDIDCYTPIQIR